MENLTKAQLDQVPALAPPAGILPDFTTQYIGLQPAFIVTITICMVLASLVVVSRFVAKLYVTKLFQIEDYVTLLAWGLYLGFSGFNYYACYIGLGRHQWDVSALRMMHIGQLTNIDEILYCFTICTGKIAILLQYKRIFVTTKRGFTYISIVVLIISNIAIYIVIIFWLAFACNPREKIWNPSIPGKCLSVAANATFSGAWNVLSDFAILFLPIRSIWGLKMSLKRKIGVSTVFTIGILACVSSINRLVYSILLLHTKDQNYVIIQLGCWSVAECAMVLLCGSFPLMPKFLQIFFPPKPRSTQYYPYNSKSDGSSSRKRNLPYGHSIPLSGNDSVVPWNSDSQLTGPEKSLEKVDSFHHGNDKPYMMSQDSKEKSSAVQMTTEAEQV